MSLPSSALFATRITGNFARRKIWATSISHPVTPLLISHRNNTKSASSVAMITCFLISSSNISSEFTTQPPVSTTENSLPFQSHLPYWRSRVVPASLLTIAWRVFVRRLNKVDFPTFGRPTIATKFPIISLLSPLQHFSLSYSGLYPK